MWIGPLKFDLQELGGALGDLGTLLPLTVALVLINGLNATSVLTLVGLLYIVSGLYFGIPTPVQPLKIVGAIAVSLGLSASVIGAAGLLMGAVLLVLSLTNLITPIARLFPHAVVRGIQLSIGLILVRKGVELAFGHQAFINAAGFSRSTEIPVGLLLTALALLLFIIFQFIIPTSCRRFPPTLAVVSLGLGAGVTLGDMPTVAHWGPLFPDLVWPSAANFGTALVVLVIPQFPLTLGNAVVGTCDAARTYFKGQAYRVTPRSLATSMGLANVVAGLVGGMPMCHGSGGLTAHYKLGARTRAANLMIGGLLLGLGVLLGSAALPFLSLIPLSVLGVLLAVVGAYHAVLVRDLTSKRQLAIAAAVGITTIVTDNLAIGFGAGIALYHLLKLLLENRSRIGKEV